MGNHGDETTEDLVRVPMLTALSHPSGWAYIYVEATVDGKITRGFVPQRDVVFDDVELPDEEAKIVGSLTAAAKSGTGISVWTRMGDSTPRT